MNKNKNNTGLDSDSNSNILVFILLGIGVFALLIFIVLNAIPKNQPTNISDTSMLISFNEPLLEDVITEGDYVLPTNIEKVGFIFLGWYDNQELLGEAVTTITFTGGAIIDVFPKWEEAVN